MGNEESCECCEEEESLGDMTMGVADKAWMKVLQRKLEAMIEKNQGEGMDKTAKIVYEYARTFYDMKMAGKKMPKGAAEAFEKKLMAAMQG